ncbi:MAG: HIT domain-containing protein [Myxococcales bacterium]|nr:HIT domain-containing protein [Myxococcales bacterium]
METLWAPWRTPYILGDDARESGCLFCNRFVATPNVENLVLGRDEAVMVMLNRYPYNNGHVMIVPREHVGQPTALAPARWGALQGITRDVCGVLTEVMRPQGLNLGLNIGAAAGAGIADHLHVHIVPRWVGDTNFMPAIGATNVISQSLAACYDALQPEIAKLFA